MLHRLFQGFRLCESSDDVENAQRHELPPKDNRPLEITL